MKYQNKFKLLSVQEKLRNFFENKFKSGEWIQLKPTGRTVFQEKPKQKRK